MQDGSTRQYLYRQNADNLSNSEIIALGGTRYLVNERDGKHHQPGKTVQKHVYLIDLANATEVSDPQNSATGLLVNGKTLEENDWESLAAAGIRPAEKTLLIDLVAANGYPHDKFEAMWLLGNDRLAVLNDDDFAINSEDGKIIQKILPANGQTDANRLYILPAKLPE